jgi:hypothetical protein
MWWFWNFNDWSLLGFLKVKSVVNKQMIKKKEREEMTSMNKQCKNAWFLDKNCLISLIWK